MDLTTGYLGMELRNPLVASAGPFGRTVDGVRRLAGAGVGAVVLASLFEEQFERGADAPGTQRERAYVPPGGQLHSPRGYLELVTKSVSAVDVPVIASLNGCTTGGWTSYASAIEQAGAGALELNLYFPQADPLTPGREVEDRLIEVLGTVKAAVTIPVAVKISPYLSSPGEVALRLDRVGADGLVLFNRLMQTGIDPETLQVDTTFELSRPADAALARMWIARLHGRVNASLAGSTGVDEARDVAAYLLAGADVVMTTSALLRHGIEHAETLLAGLTGWMNRKGFVNLSQVRGLLAEPAARDGAGESGESGESGEESDRTGYLTALHQATSKYVLGGN
jgi:dihydroorotate dehydrogenase (fumarate)